MNQFFQRAPRVAAVAALMTAALVALAARLYQLQILQYEEYAVQATGNYQRDDVVRALRGEIRTRDGVLLATNRLAVDLVYTGRHLHQGGDLAQAIPAWDKIIFLAGIQDDVLVNGQPREPESGRESETVLARNIAPDRVSALYEYTVLVPSLQLRERVERVYPQGTLAAHLLGYVQEASEDQVREEGFTPGDLVGRSGLEFSLQTTLQGRNGMRRREVTAAGTPQTERTLESAQRGQDVTLTIDARLQRAAEGALREGLEDVNQGRARAGQPAEPYTRGAVIAIDPRTNEVLAMASSPAYDPNWFARVPSADPVAKSWAIDPSRPLAEVDAVTSNRAVQAYTPGSVFKIATTLMYLERWGNFTVPCLPVYYFGRSPKRNWARYSLGVVDARLAISYSCNPWYYDSAARAEPAAYSRQLKARLTELGYARPTGLELVGEKTGVLLNADDYATPQAPWYPGFGLNMSIGQGDVLVTPAQLVAVMSTIINDGQRRPLTVLRTVAGTRVARKPAVSVVRGEDIRAFQLVKEGMAGTTAGTRYGTAQHELGPKLFPVRTGGKTGTAENGRSFRDGLAYTHAWYEGYGPIERANFAVVAFFQNGGEGSGPALKAVKKLFAARWCVTLDRQGSAPPGAQQPCTGELDEMRRWHAQVKSVTVPDAD